MDNNDINNQVSEIQEDEQRRSVAEMPEDEFSAIDILISTPESIQELRDNIQREKEEYNLVEEKFQAAKDVFEKAEQEFIEKKDRLQALQNSLDNALANVPAEILPIKNDNQVDDNVQAARANIDVSDANVVGSGKIRKSLIYSAIACIVLIVGITAIYLFNNNGDKDNKKSEKVENVKKENSKPEVKTDSTKIESNNDSDVQKIVFDGSKPLEIIVTEHYGYHDAVFKVIEYNKLHGVFDDWRNIQLGTEILLPKIEKNVEQTNDNRNRRSSRHRTKRHHH